MHARPAVFSPRLGSARAQSAGVPIVSLCIPLTALYNRTMLERQPDQLSLGGLWRDVLNFLGDAPISPDVYLPLADAVAPKWASWTYFLGHAASKLSEDRVELEADVARARIGWRIWTERREELRAFAQNVARHPVDDEMLERWWLFDARGETALWNGSVMGVGDKRASDFQRRTKLSEEDQLALRYHPDMRDPYSDSWHLAWIHQDLGWTDDLETLRRLARKTWSADPRDRERWTQAELLFVNAFYEEQEPSLTTPDEEPESIDPFELQVWNEEQSLGFGLDGLRYVMYVFMRAVVIDFADSILERTRRPTARGSLSCVECGRFVGRRALGYGQLYCSDRCKKRAAKRRYRQRIGAYRDGPVLRVVQ